MSDDRIGLPAGASLAELQRYVHALEAMHGWLDADAARCCFLMGEEVGELFRAVRRLERAPDDAARVTQAGEEIVDVLNYLLAIANRLGIDVEAAFREKNLRNQGRRWEA
ncbi:MAG TPA: MazG nucleotide pyrophosphohydrolase domain-containing protein [Myxococcota bacterium]|nr:MazG nucleotide pyrophosphohydrolase domain-containing protein [Myxococcota bacterium]